MDGSMERVTEVLPRLSAAGSPHIEEARKAILDTIEAACGATLAEALEIQARRSGGFMTGTACRDGVIGTAYRKTAVV